MLLLLLEDPIRRRTDIVWWTILAITYLTIGKPGSTSPPLRKLMAPYGTFPAAENAVTDLIERLKHVYWLGGSPCAGKSSVAKIIAERRGFQLYSSDDHFEEHKARRDPQKHPIFSALATLSCDELWMRPVAVQVETELAYSREVFGLMVEDLLQFPPDRPLLAEGTDLLPDCVKPLLADVRNAFWLVPTVEFQYNYYSKREWVNDILKNCTQPAKAFANWMGRDVAYADTVEQTAFSLHLPVMRVDGDLPVRAIAPIVENSFGLSTGK